MINGMVYKIRTGVSWRDLPERYGPWKSVYTRFRRYAIDGVFTRALQQIQAQADAAGDIDWLVQIDSTIVRAHQHAAATGRKRGKHRTDEPDDHALGRSRGGLTAEIPLACDGRGRPLAVLLTPGQRHDGVCVRPLPGRIRVPRTGRPRCRPDHVIADKAYSSRGFRAYLRRRGIGHTIPEKNDQKMHRRNRGRRGGRPTAFDSRIYRRRNTVERCFSQLKGFRGIATRYEKTATSYEAAVTLASLLLWARSI
ncbi:Transposase DDE domain protein [Streptomyces lavendulae subsp. lavendulae]|uniref:Transposase DDE domain protein n=1 Tax=Streptomyces lavendulae subsp. lavendulae TaxID=58340 RepID=A0A2K8PRV6_STRLA|nr:Transposase DDE domain protein [Streptomyces lavendulae subsp. lavendulae]QUQ59236.1 IS5 family transposase ISBli8 [Streptomyces lavendulae subsp. lavendulae]